MTLVHRLWEQARPFDYDDRFRGAYIFCFDPQQERGPDSIGDRFRQLDVGERSADLVVFRGASSLLKALETDALLPHLLGSTPAVSLIPDEHEGAWPTLRAPSWSRGGEAAVQRLLAMSSDAAATVLCDAELRSFMVNSRAIWMEGDRFHFLLPSLKHAPGFIRLGEMLTDPLTVARIADWLNPHVRTNSLLLADTGSILPLLLEIRLRVFQQHGTLPHIGTLPEYPASPDEVNRRVQELLIHAGEPPRVLFVNSVNSTGNLIRLVTSLMPEAIELTVVSICDAGSIDTHPNTFLCSFPIDRFEPDSDGRCAKCVEGQTVIVIDRRSYERLPVRPKPVPHKLSWRRAVELSSFWEAAQRTDAIKLHYNPPENPARHRAVYVDVAQLLTDPWFRGQAIAKLRLYLTALWPELVLIPEHAGTVSMRELLSSAMADAAFKDRAQPSVFAIAPGSLSDDLKRVIGPATKILVLDDAIVTGSTIYALRDQVYAANQQLGHSANVGLFAVLLRPNDEHPLRRLERHYRDRDVPIRVGFVEQFRLPLDCPWCQERTLLGRCVPQLESGQDILRRRLVILREPITSTTLAGLSAGRFTERSFLGRLDDRTAFASVSSVVWEAARSIDMDDDPEHPQYFDLEHLFEAFYDPIIRAAALRTVQRRHVRYPLQNDGAISEALRVDPAKTGDEDCFELILAAAMAKLPARGVVELVGRCQTGPGQMEAWTGLIGVATSYVEPTATV
jgi:hypothetical protein